MKQIELEIPVDDMDEADLRATFAEVMEAHEQNIAEFNELQTALEEAEAADERVEALENEVNEFRAYFAEKGEEVTGIDSDVLAERFEPGELVQFAQKYDEQAQAVVTEEADDEAEAEFAEADDEAEEEEASVFADRPSKAPAFSNDDLDARKEAAKQRLQGLGGIALE